MDPHIPTVTILGVPVARLAPEVAIREIERICVRGSPATVAYANAHTLNVAYGLPELHTILRGAELVLNDGSGVALAARMKGKPFADNLNGSDFNPRILELAARREWPVFFLGAQPGIAERAAARLTDSISGLPVAGTHHGYFKRQAAEEVVSRVRDSGAIVLMVAMGNPTQELWIRDNLVATGARLGVGVGAFFDFAAGNVPRAPAWMNRTGIEWIYRLKQEPARMWRRYLLGNPVFLTRVLREWRADGRR
jgi:exopolysaccharide biosynthesis WecB/TagA/CpsF family protein